MRLCSKAAIALGVGTTAALVVVRSDLHRAVHNVRTYSAPDARLYDSFAGLLFGPLYRRLAADVASIRTSGRLLEIGPGPGHLATDIARETDLAIVGVDIDAAMIDRARRRAERSGLADRVRFELGDVAALPFDGESFDMAVSSFSLHHWPDRTAGLREIHRVLRPGGRAVIWDIHPFWTHLDTGGPTAGDALAASPFGRAEPTVVRWPFGLPAVVRFDLVRSAEVEPDSPAADRET